MQTEMTLEQNYKPFGSSYEGIPGARVTLGIRNSVKNSVKLAVYKNMWEILGLPD